MEDFRCVTETISEIKTIVDEMQELLYSAYEKALVLQGEMSDVNKWDGEAQKAGVAFMDLTLQYHTALANPDGGPLVQAGEALQKYLDKDSVFYQEWEAYQNIKAV